MNLRSTRHPLDAASRAKIVQLLNDVIAVLIDLRLQVKQAHWNVRGSNLIAIHELFDTFAGQLDESTDEIAERAVALGGRVAGTLPGIGNVTSLPPLSPETTGSFDLIELLAERYAAVSAILGIGINHSQEVNDEVTADLLITAAHSIDKNLWLLESHLEPEFTDTDPDENSDGPLL
jgi:starvation-inducible DNA-binding protein